MTAPKNMTIFGTKYVRDDSVPVLATKKQIVVLQRGWVVVGDVEKSESEVKISNCAVIRIWGTTKGLGEIAENGPTDKTELNPCPDVIVHPLSVVLCMNTELSKWQFMYNPESFSISVNGYGYSDVDSDGYGDGYGYGDGDGDGYGGGDGDGYGSGVGY